MRFLVGGLVTASVPLVARRISPGVAGVLVLVPAITLVSFIFIGQDGGPSAVSKAAGSALVALPAVFGFLLGVFLVTRRNGAVPLALLLGFALWLTVAIPVSILVHRR